MSRSLDIAKILRATEINNTENNRLLFEGESLPDGLDSANVQSIGMLYYSTLDSLPTTNLEVGLLSFVEENRRLYLSDGNGWYNTAFVASALPYWVTEPNADYTITDSATPLTITALANDSDNPNLINQSFGSDSAQYMVTVSNDSSVFTFTPKSADSIGIEVGAGNLTDSNGDFVYTFKWSDGINFVSKAVTITYNVAGPTGIDWGGDRGLIAGGQLSVSPYYTQVIDYVDISNSGNASNFGNIGSNLDYSAGLSDGSRGVYGGGSVNDTTRISTIYYLTTSTTGNASTFGSLQSGRMSLSSASDGTKGYFMGGARPDYATVNSIEYITIQTTGNATDEADLSVNRNSAHAWNDATRSLIMGGTNGQGTLYNSVDYYTMGSNTNAADFGDLSQIRFHGGGGGDATYALHFGGYNQSSLTTNDIDYFTIQTTGNASDFGNLTSNTINAAGASNGTYTIAAGGGSGSAKSSIDYVTVATPSDATDFGDLTSARQFATGLSGDAA